MSIFLYLLFDYQIGWIAYKKEDSDSDSISIVPKLSFESQYNDKGQTACYYKKFSDDNDWIVLYTHYPPSPHSWIENYTTSSIIFPHHISRVKMPGMVYRGSQTNTQNYILKGSWDGIKEAKCTSRFENGGKEEKSCPMQWKQRSIPRSSRWWICTLIEATFLI